jgi:hypothetical protein
MKRRLGMVLTALLAASSPVTTWFASSANAAPAGGCNGAWTKVPSPHRQGESTQLGPVDILTPSDAWGVGVETSGGHFRGLIEHWDGSAWKRTDVPNAGSIVPYDVEAIATDDVWVVGVGASDQNVALHWDGAWAIVPTPALGPSSVLKEVEAIATGDIWAVGRMGGPGVNEHPLALHWDGAVWSEMRAGLHDHGALVDLAVIGSDVRAVQRTGTFTDTHLFSWTGSAWEEDATAPDLALIDAPPAGPLWGIGVDHKPYHLHAGTWEPEHPPAAPPGYTDFYFDLSVAGPGDVWLAGYIAQGSKYRPALQHWEGGTWTLIDLPSKGPDTLLENVRVANGRGFGTGFHREQPSGPLTPYVVTACGM